jgi:hypothetical protein
VEVGGRRLKVESSKLKGEGPKWATGVAVSSGWYVVGGII